MNSAVESLSDYIRKHASDGPLYMPYLTVGDPGFEQTIEFASAMIEAGAGILELGIPFSDPTADGPVIQAAMVRALANQDFSMERVFAVAGEIHRRHPEVPIVFLSYLNPILRGHASGRRVSFATASERSVFDVESALHEFLGRCEKAGVRGLVIPDLPFDEEEGKIILRAHEEGSGVAQILMVAPNTSPERLEKICERARGFIYYVTSLGVTGTRKDLPQDLEERVGLVKDRSGLPVLAGFGIHEAGQISPLRGLVDGIIVGSLHHQIISELGDGAGPELARRTREFVSACRGT